MSKDYIFSWAENAEGRMVYVDEVPGGLRCGCTCPYCHEKLLARHGDVREHGFAHHSENRGANLKICYMVILYKLAEQIICTKKRIHAPSYYGIYEETDLEFTDVKIDSSFEREDKQPDVIAITKDNKQFLIEFVFQYKVQHKQKIDYKNLTCLEVDISDQTLESLEDFLLSSNENRRWINNEIYFNGIEDTYRNTETPVRIISETDCLQCVLRSSCCAVMKSPAVPLTIENNGNKYRICKIERYNEEIEAHCERLQERRHIERYCTDDEFRENVSLEKQAVSTSKQDFSILQSENMTQSEQQDVENDVSERSCFYCKSNLTWANRGNGLADCGCFPSMGLPKRQVSPDYAKKCKGFKRK